MNNIVNQNFNHNGNGNSNQNIQLTTVPSSGLPCLKSKVESKTTMFVWEINGISNIAKQRLWRVPSCEFSVGPYKWRLSLEDGAKGNILYAKPELIHGTSASYFLRLSVLNAQNYVLHSPQFLPDHPLFYDSGCQDSFAQHGNKWEVLRFSDGFVDLFSNYLVHDRLRILVDMTVYVNSDTQ